jgi:hypothetical protein
LKPGHNVQNYSAANSCRMTGNPEVGLGCSLSKDYNNPEKRYAQREEGDTKEGHPRPADGPPRRSSASTTARTLDAGNRRCDWHHYGRNQGTAVPRPEGASQIIDPETDAPTSICQRIRLLPAGQWFTGNTAATGAATRTAEQSCRGILVALRQRSIRLL